MTDTVKTFEFHGVLPEDRADNFFLLWCKECEWQKPISLENPLPFSSADERHKWAAAHRNGTGHDFWHTYTLIKGVGTAHGTFRGIGMFTNGH